MGTFLVLGLFDQNPFPKVDTVFNYIFIKQFNLLSHLVLYTNFVSICLFINILYKFL